MVWRALEDRALWLVIARGLQSDVRPVRTTYGGWLGQVRAPAGTH